MTTRIPQLFPTRLEIRAELARQLAARREDSSRPRRRDAGAGVDENSREVSAEGPRLLEKAS